jgi:hypothetical protein
MLPPSQLCALALLAAFAASAPSSTARTADRFLRLDLELLSFQ